MDSISFSELTKYLDIYPHLVFTVPMDLVLSAQQDQFCIAYATSGNPVEARRCFQSALNLDGSDPWRWTLQTELGTAGIRTLSKGGETEPS